MSFIIIDHEAGEIIHLVASVCASILARSGRYWYFAKYSERSSETQVSYTLKKIIECSSQGAFEMVGHSKLLLFRQVAPSRSITLLIHERVRLELDAAAGPDSSQKQPYESG